MKKQLKTYILLWSTQSLSALGSAMTSYALVLQLYLDSGSALKTALLSVCSYAPYVIMSIFAGTLSDRWNKKKTMLICDTVAALSTAAVLALIKADALTEVHLYIINAVNGLMNTVQQPAGEVAATQLIPKEYYQKTSAMRSFSQSLNSILTPVIATMIFSFAGIETVIAVDLLSFAIAFLALLFFIKIPEPEYPEEEQIGFIKQALEGLRWLRIHPLILELILFLACVNLTASAYDAALPAMILSKSAGGKSVLGAVNACVGVSSLIGSLLTAFAPPPKSRIRAICVCIFISICTENFLLAFAKTPLLWCIGSILGWLPIPYMNANMDVIFRNEIPPEIQGRIFSCRNTLQFFTIPLGLLLGGFLTDSVFEPFAYSHRDSSLLTTLFGAEKGAGAAMLFFAVGSIGGVICLIFSLRLKKYKKY